MLWACATSGPPEGGRQALRRFEYRQVHMGVQARIVLWTTGESAARSAASAAFARLAEVDDALSDWRVDGELARLEQHAGGAPVQVSADLYRCLERALEVAHATDGAFDPTLGALTRLWREARATGISPSEHELQAARARTDWRQVELDPRSCSARLACAGMELDLGGIGKGYGADRALETLAVHGVESALVGLAGDHALGAPPPGEPGWRIAVGDDPETSNVLVLSRCGVSTSGDSEQFLELDGVRTSHILDPRTGRGVVGRPFSTVVAADAASADALATALSVLGPEAGWGVLAAFPGAEVRLEPRP